MTMKTMEWMMVSYYLLGDLVKFIISLFTDSVFKSSEEQDGIKDISIDCFGRKLQCSVSP